MGGEDNSAPSIADHYRALADDAYAASDGCVKIPSIMRQIAVSYHRLAAIADAEERSAQLSAFAGRPAPEANVA
jgi:hypothetical protein